MKTALILLGVAASIVGGILTADAIIDRRKRRAHQAEIAQKKAGRRG